MKKNILNSKEILIYYNNIKILNPFIVCDKIDLAIGLMFSSKLKSDKGLLMCLPDYNSRYLASVHMFFVFRCLDIIFMNKNLEIIDLVRLRPFMPIYIPKEVPKYVLETSKAIISDFGLKVGDKLNFKE